MQNKFLLFLLVKSEQDATALFAVSMVAGILIVIFLICVVFYCKQKNKYIKELKKAKTIIINDPG